MPKRGKGKMLDLDKALELVKENEWKAVYIGLAEDWLYTSGKVEADGRISHDCDHVGPVCLSSRWATPVVVIGEDEEVVIECWKDDDGYTFDCFNDAKIWKRFFKANR